MSRPLFHWPAIFRALRSSQVPARPRRRARRRFSPQCLPREQLEGRAVPAVIPLTVTSLADTGAGTLRSAITTANSGPASNIYVIDIVKAGMINLASALPDLSRNITILGLGASTSTVQRGPGLSTPFRIFTIDRGDTASLTGLTIANGNAGRGDGGGLENFGTVTVSNSVFTGNSAGFGGGLANESGGTARVSGSTFTRNSAGQGGGIDNAGTASVSGSTFTSNSATIDGGGLYNFGTASVSGSTFTSNSAGSDGGGLVNVLGGTVSVSGSTFTSNSARSFGGGLDNGSGTARVSGSSFTRNSAGTDGGGLDNVGTVSVSGSSFTSNTATTNGGGLANERGGTASVSGSSFTRNSAGVAGGGIFNLGALMQSGNTFTGNHPNDVS